MELIDKIHIKISISKNIDIIIKEGLRNIKIKYPNVFQENKDLVKYYLSKYIYNTILNGNLIKRPLKIEFINNQTYIHDGSDTIYILNPSTTKHILNWEKYL